MYLFVSYILLPLNFVLSSPPTFQDLMNPDLFPEPQCGMLVEQAEVVNGTLSVLTTGAEFSLHTTGDGIFKQRIEHSRPVLNIKFENGFDGISPKITVNSPGRVFVSSDSCTFCYGTSYRRCWNYYR